MIVDQFSVKTLSAAITNTEMTNAGIRNIYFLEKERQAYPKSHAIYFISPFKEQVQLLVNDFADKKNPQYASASIFFTNNLTQNLMNTITQNQNLLKYLLEFFEFNLDYKCEEENTFNLRLPQALPVCFSKYGMNEEQLLSEDIALKLASVLPAMGDFYKVNIIYNLRKKPMKEF